MHATIRLLAGCAGFLAMTVLLALASAPPAITQAAGGARLAAKPPPPPPTPVQVVNIPLPVTGSVNAAVAGPVQAQQSGPWNVGITGTPGVQVTNSPLVQVGNPLLPVQVLNEALNEPFNHAFFAGMSAGTASKTIGFDVPDGKRLIIETVSVLVSVFLGQTAACVLATETVVHTNLSLLPGLTDGVIQQWVGTHALTIRVDGGPGTDEVQFRIQRSSDAGAAETSASVRGYLVDR